MASSITTRQLWMQTLSFASSRLVTSGAAALFAVPVQQQQQTRYKHYNPKWKRQRREKYLKTPLPDFNAAREAMAGTMSPGEIRAFMKQKGAVPFASSSRIVSLLDSGEIFDPYVPKEDAGVSSGLTAGVKESVKMVTKKVMKVRGKRSILKHDDEFDLDTFTTHAQELYEQVHNLLPKVFPRNFLSSYQDEDDYYKLHDLVTELAYPAITSGLKDKTLVWRFVESLEPPRAVNVVVGDRKKAGNKYGQVTVRFYSRQIMALYDRFGRLMYGSETVPKDTIDYIVFEKRLSDTYGQWRLHGRIRPDWKEEVVSFRRTMVMDSLEEEKKESVTDGG